MSYSCDPALMCLGSAPFFCDLYEGLSSHEILLGCLGIFLSGHVLISRSALRHQPGTEGRKAPSTHKNIMAYQCGRNVHVLSLSPSHPPGIASPAHGRHSTLPTLPHSYLLTITPHPGHDGHPHRYATRHHVHTHTRNTLTTIRMR